MCSLIQSGVDEGAKLLLDGRDVNVKGYESGYFVGPTVIGGVTVREFSVSVRRTSILYRAHRKSFCKGGKNLDDDWLNILS